MNEEDQAAPASTEQAGEENQNDEAQEGDAEGSQGEETVEELKARLEKERELANNYKIRAEKAEKKAKEAPKAPAADTKDLSTTDLLAIVRSNVADEDVADLQTLAKVQNTTVAEILKTDLAKSILADKAEKRATAQATATGAARRQNSKVTGETLLQEASTTGKLPESTEDMQQLVLARQKKGR